MFFQVPRDRLTQRGRGAVSNRSGRYEREQREVFDDGWGSADDAPPRLETLVTVEKTRSALSFNDSPDIGFEEIAVDLLQGHFWTGCGFGNDPLLLTEKTRTRFLHLHPRSEGLYQIAKDPDSGSLALSGLLSSPDLWEM